MYMINGTHIKTIFGTKIIATSLLEALTASPVIKTIASLVLVLYARYVISRYMCTCLQLDFRTAFDR